MPHSHLKPLKSHNFWTAEDIWIQFSLLQSCWSSSEYFRVYLLSREGQNHEMRENKYTANESTIQYMQGKHDSSIIQL
jgi:hypothetical protein